MSSDPFAGLPQPQWDHVEAKPPKESECPVCGHVESPAWARTVAFLVIGAAVAAWVAFLAWLILRLFGITP